jgi:hypothetical protein
MCHGDSSLIICVSTQMLLILIETLLPELQFGVTRIRGSR